MTKFKDKLRQIQSQIFSEASEAEGDSDNIWDTKEMKAFLKLSNQAMKEIEVIIKQYRSKAAPILKTLSPSQKEDLSGNLIDYDAKPWHTEVARAIVK